MKIVAVQSTPILSTTEEMFNGLVGKTASEMKEKDINTVIEDLKTLLRTFPGWLFIKRREEFEHWLDMHETFKLPEAPGVLAWMLELWQGNWKHLPQYLPELPGESQDDWLERCYAESGYGYIAPENLPVKEPKKEKKA